MLTVGIALRYRPARFMALALFGIVIVKAFLNNVWLMDKMFRIVAFVGLGALLLWLPTSTRSSVRGFARYWEGRAMAMRRNLSVISAIMFLTGLFCGTAHSDFDAKRWEWRFPVRPKKPCRRNTRRSFSAGTSTCIQNPTVRPSSHSGRPT